MRRVVYLLLAAFCVALINFRLQAQSENNTVVQGKSVLPPVMSLPEAENNSAKLAALSIPVDDGEKQFVLFVPNDWKAPKSGELSVIFHFNGEPNMVAQQHLQYQLTNPLVVVSWGTGTETYRGPFKDDARFGRWLKLIEEKLAENGASKEARITTVDMSAYGGGYGAVRRILATDYGKMVRRLVLCDSMYASYAKEEGGGDGKKKLSQEHVDPWLPIIRAAAEGKKTFVFAFSQVVTTGYASCAECADALAEIVEAPMEPVETDDCPAANDEDFPLIKRSDIGHFHQWGYAGASDTAHSVHLQHLGDIWKVLDEAGAP